MLEQLLKIAQENMQGISRSFPELNDLDSKEVTEVTSQTIVNMIMQQARKGDVHSLQEMLSGKPTGNDHAVIHRLKDPLVNQLQSRLNITQQSAEGLALIALPIIMNMLNHKVQDAKTGGIDIHNSISSIRSNGKGIVNEIVSLFGTRNQNSKRIDGILESLMH